MGELNPSSPAPPLFSLVIACFNDWEPLNRCLGSLAEQIGGASFEVIVVDDGSRETAPEFIREWSRHYPLVVVRQSHKGISAARNRGVQDSCGATIVFVDADCKLQANCLAALQATLEAHPEHNYFQLRLIGDTTTPIGRVEELRLITIQEHRLRPDGCIRYLNTAGFAIRRAKAVITSEVFDPQARRGEDTLFLVNLMLSGELPWFVESAVVQHAIPLTLLQCFFKDVRSAYLEAGTHDLIDAKGVVFRITHRERINMLKSMWRTSARPSIGRAAWFALAMRQAIRFVMLLLTDASHLRSSPRESVGRV